MAERVLFHVVGQIIGWLGSATAQEIGSIWDVEDELQELKDTLSSITAVLLDAEEQQLHSHGVRNWLERLEDVVYDVDDLLDEFCPDQALQQNNKYVKKVRAFFSTSNQLFLRHKLAHKVKILRKTLAKIAADRRDFHLEVVPHEKLKVVTSYRDTHSSVLEKNVIGREEDKMAILNVLLNSKNGIEENLLVIPIVGIGGLGKTTLAQVIFNDERVQEHFDLKIWVWVSVNFDVKLLVEKIVTTTTHVCPKNLEMEQLQRRLHGKINMKRYLLILDDVWNEDPEKWKSLRDLLVKDAKECRMIVTTRSKKVAKLVGTVEPYHLEILDGDKAWCLFKNMVFGQEKEPTNFNNIVEIGKKIVQKCGGIPLAIRAIGGMLHFKDPESEWPPFVQKELLEISQNGNLDNMVFQTLRLSYDHLPSYLKHCFAYCSLFPKGHKINVEMLIHLWIAQGFIKSLDPNESLELLGRDSFTELLWRSFFQEFERDDVSGYIKTCKMHDLIHDLAILIAGKKCVTLGSNKIAIQKETRHLSFHFHLDSLNQVPTSWTRAKRMRSILLPSQSFNVINETFAKSFCNVITLHFKFVRLLDLQKLGIKIVPESIGELRHLRYLDLSVNWDIRALPNSITKLFNLQALKLNHCRLEELPRDIKKLVNLRHLEIRENRLTRMPRGLGELTELRTLSQFVLSEATRSSAVDELNELVRLNNLRGLLQIKNLRHGMEATGANFKDKHHLQSLHLQWGCLVVGESNLVDHGLTLEGLRSIPRLKELKLERYEGVNIPSWIPFSFTSLVKFELRDCVNCQHLPLLDQFHSLRMLKLENMPSLESIMSYSESFIASAMPSLRCLEMYYLPNLKGWWRDVVIDDDDSVATKAKVPSSVKNHKLASFPSLSSLRIFNCPKLISMPLYPNVEELVLESASWRPLQQTLTNVATPYVSTMVTEEASSSTSCIVPISSSSPLSRLRTLVLGGNQELQSLPSQLESLSSLKELHISHCSKLKSLSSTIQHPASLEILKIRNCMELDISSDDAITWKLFGSLRSLSFDKLPKLVTLPEGLQHVTTLHHLEISHCQNLMGIPDWVQNFSSLTTLEIWECPKLRSLPEAIRSLTSLETLMIYDCPILLQRCERERGEDWPKIANIPTVALW